MPPPALPRLHAACSCMLGSLPRSELHSFPTRRSSDLAYEDQGRTGRDLAPARQGPQAGFSKARLPRVAPACSGIAANLSLDRDRKSTRLNSSHTVISYAVFCLKKKNETPHTIPTHREQ